LGGCYRVQSATPPRGTTIICPTPVPATLSHLLSHPANSKISQLYSSVYAVAKLILHSMYTCLFNENTLRKRNLWPECGKLSWLPMTSLEAYSTYRATGTVLTFYQYYSQHFCCLHSYPRCYTIHNTRYRGHPAVTAVLITTTSQFHLPKPYESFLH